VDEAPTTLARLLWRRATSSPDDLAYRHPVGGRDRGGWEDVSWAQARALVEPLSAGLVELGVAPGDHVAILSRTRVDWVLAHLAVLCAGAATVAVRPDSPAEEVARAVDGPGCVVVLAEDVGQVDKLRRVRGDIRTVRKVVQFDGDYPDHRVMTFEALLSAGEDALHLDPALVTRRVDGVPPEAVATLLPGLGPLTGSDGVRRTHADWVAQGVAAAGPANRLRLLSTPLTRLGSHALLARQLTSGQGTVVDARGPEPGAGQDPARDAGRGPTG
jgi:long-chain acyl-CoA synthetase